MTRVRCLTNDGATAEHHCPFNRSRYSHSGNYSSQRHRRTARMLFSLAVLDPRCTFSIYLCPPSLWVTLPRGVLSTYWCCLSRPCMVFPACVHLALFLALSLSPRNSLGVTIVSSENTSSVFHRYLLLICVALQLMWNWYTHPPIHSIRATMIVCRLGRKIMGTAICCIVYDSCTQWYAS